MIRDDGISRKVWENMTNLTKTLLFKKKLINEGNVKIYKYLHQDFPKYSKLNELKNRNKNRCKNQIYKFLRVLRLFKKI